jgi:hypothetical protein
MHIKSKLKSSPEMYARQRHLSFYFFASTSLPEMKVTGKLPGKEMIIWFASKKKKK